MRVMKASQDIAKTTPSVPPMRRGFDEGKFEKGTLNAESSAGQQKTLPKRSNRPPGGKYLCFSQESKPILIEWDLFGSSNPIPFVIGLVSGFLRV